MADFIDKPIEIFDTKDTYKNILERNGKYVSIIVKSNTYGKVEYQRFTAEVEVRNANTCEICFEVGTMKYDLIAKKPLFSAIESIFDKSEKIFYNPYCLNKDVSYENQILSALGMKEGKKILDNQKELEELEK